MEQRSNTDLFQAKIVAKWLLNIEIHNTPYSPMVVQHPFASSGFMLLPGDEFPIDITKSAENINRWREYMSGLIDKADNAYQIFIMLNKTYGLTFLKYAKQYLSTKDLSEILADAWIRSENPNMDANVTKSELAAMFEQADKAALMTDEERKRLSEMDDTITIYRGVTPYNAKNVRALSWTTNIKKAEWFANRYGQRGTVYKTQISKAKVLAYFTSRGESEIIVNPKEIKNLQAI